jgi:Mrp family chromosome partitioning ATPase
LIGKVGALDALQNAGRNLAVLACGPVPPNPSELLITSQANTIIRQIAATVDFVIIDTAPLLPVADGAEVAAMSDATLVVHHGGKTTRDQAERSVEALAKVGERPVGVVLNMMTRTRGDYGYSYGYYYTYRPNRSRRAKERSTSHEPGTATSDALTSADEETGRHGQNQKTVEPAQWQESEPEVARPQQR